MKNLYGANEYFFFAFPRAHEITCHAHDIFFQKKGGVLNDHPENIKIRHRGKQKSLLTNKGRLAHTAYLSSYHLRKTQTQTLSRKIKFQWHTNTKNRFPLYYCHPLQSTDGYSKK